jgi:hypothetical protein
MKARIVAVLIALLPGPALLEAQAPVSAPPTGPVPLAAPASAPAAAVSSAPVYPGPPLVEAGGPTCLPDGGACSTGGNQFWANADFLLWTLRRQDFFPVNSGDHGGIRAGFGFWLDSEQCYGIEASGFVLARAGANLLSTTATTAEYDSTSNMMWSGEVNVRSTCLQIGTLTFSGIAGFRFLELNENFDRDLVTISDPTMPPVMPPQFTTNSVRTTNSFYGGHVGIDADWVWGPCFLSVRGKVGLGMMHESVSGNVRTLSRNRISSVDEVNVKLGYQITHWLSGYVGYDYLLASSVVRSSTADSNLTAQGFTFGVEIGY